MVADWDGSALPGELIEQLQQELNKADIEAASALKLVLASAVERLGAKESSVLVPAGDDTLTFFASTNEELIKSGGFTVPIGTSIAGFVFLTGQTTAMDKASDNPNYYGTIDERLKEQAEQQGRKYDKTKEYIAAPIVRGDSVLGILTFVNRSDEARARAGDMPDGSRFTKGQVFLASRYAELCGLILDHLDKVRRQASATASILQSTFGDSAQKTWLDSPLMTRPDQSEQVALRAAISAEIDHLADDDLRLVQSLIHRLSAEHVDA